MKFEYLQRAFTARRGDEDEFRSYRETGGAALQRFAIHEALSEHVAREAGKAVPWPRWLATFREPGSDSVARFARDHAERVSFHCWLQWIAATQLARAQARARQAGMRLGLYTDMAVGVAVDGAMTWGERELVVAGAHIGAPPDAFNQAGQDWGLTPVQPSALMRRGMAPWREDLRAGMACAGAMRLDHAMSLKRLYCIPDGFGARDGAYVRYPFGQMIGAVAAESHAASCLVIGEALGVVPAGFRDNLAAANMLAYQLLFFERRRDGRFRKPRAWSRMALACVSTHDLPTLAGWWCGRDIEWRERAGIQTAADSGPQRRARARDRALLVEDVGGIHGAQRDPEMTPALATSIHRHVAKTPARLFAVQIEDALGVQEQANLPGDVSTHPNWRRRLPVAIEDLTSHAHFASVVDGVASERSRPL